MRWKILVADDEKMISRLISRGLSTRDCEVVTASNGVQAVELARAVRPDLIILDVQMPFANGWEVLKKLRSQSQTRAIPVIMLTRHREISDKVGGLDMGADDYITKPFEMEELCSRVMSMLRRTQLALSFSPLTRLPGTPSIKAEVNRRIAEDVPFAFLYGDINNFKSYNDHYGFARGDEVLKTTAQLFADSIRSADAKDAFLGHVGGDDFVVVVEPESAARVANYATTFFDWKAVTFYDPADLSRGYIEVPDRQGNHARFPLLTISIGVATTKSRILDHYATVVAIATEMKAYCKSLRVDKLSRFSFDRRQYPNPAVIFNPP